MIRQQSLCLILDYSSSPLNWKLLYTSNTNKWVLSNTLAQGANEMLQITAKVVGVGIIVNTAEITLSSEPDLDSIPNSNN